MILLIEKIDQIQICKIETIKHNEKTNGVKREYLNGQEYSFRVNNIQNNMKKMMMIFDDEKKMKKKQEATTEEAIEKS